MADRGDSKSVSPSESFQDKGKNKRKLLDPSLKDLINLPPALTEFPRYEQSTEKPQSLPSDLLLLKATSNQSKEEVVREVNEAASWDDPIVHALEELLSSSLHALFRDVIKQIVECGYSEDVAKKSILWRGLYYGGKDLMTDVVNDTLTFLRKGKGVDTSRDDVFEDLQQLVKYIMLEMINVLKEVKPSLSIAEAMWWLLMCDLNISQACTGEGDILSFIDGKDISKDGSSNSTASESTPETRSSVTIPLNTSEPNTLKSSNPNAQSSLPETLKFGTFANSPKPINPTSQKELLPDRDNLVSIAKSVEKSLSSVEEHVQNMSRTLASEERPTIDRKGRSKKELATVQQKCFQGHAGKTYKAAYGKGTFKSGRLVTKTMSSFVLEKRVKPPTDLPTVQSKSGSSKSKIGTEIGAAADGSLCISDHTPKSDSLSTVSLKVTTSALPVVNVEHAASSSSEKNPASKTRSNVIVPPKMPDHYVGIPFDESLGKYVPRDEKDELLLKLVPRVQELKNELNGWIEWANQKVMQATRRLSKDQAELKALRQEKQEAEHCKRDKQMLEENTMKRLSEMEFSLNNLTSQLERSNITVRKLELEQVLLKNQMEIAKFQAAESTKNCREALEREQKAIKNAQSWEGQKALLREELGIEKQKAAELPQEINKAKSLHNQIEARWKEEKVAKDKLLAQAASIRKEREQLEAAAKAEEEMLKLKAGKEMKKYTENIKKLESQISLLKFKSDSYKLAALGGSVDGGFSSFQPGCKSVYPTMKGNQMASNHATGGLKQEYECVMCLAEEKSVVFLPCAHQVLCPKCNELHEKQGMKDCPSCRTPIQRRICARFARP